MSITLRIFQGVFLLNRIWHTIQLLTVSCLLLLTLQFSAAAPVVDFSADPVNGPAPLAVTFTDQSSDSPGSWSWYFGDETFSDAWTEQNPDSGWVARMGHSTVALPDGSIVLTGGSDDENKNDVWRSDDKGVSWTLVNESAGWNARYMHSTAALPDGSIVLTGGFVNGYANDVWLSEDRGSTWTQVNRSPGWKARMKHSTVVLPDGSIVLTGGYASGWPNFGHQNDTWRSTDKGATWTQMSATAGWSERSMHTSVALPDGSIVLMGGNGDDGNYNDTWRSSDRGASWTLVNASGGWSGRAYLTSALMPDGSILLMAGSEGADDTNDVWRSADNGATWMQVPDAGWSARALNSLAALPDGSIVLTGGHDSGYRNDTWRFQPAGSTEQNPLHTYTGPGSYRVSLTVTDAEGSNTLIKNGYISVSESASVIPLPGYTLPPTDPDQDGVYEDLNGNGEAGFNDVVLFFKYIDWIDENEPVPAFDFTGNGEIGYNDIVWLFREM